MMKWLYPKKYKHAVQQHLLLWHGI